MTDTMIISGASGFVGRQIVPALLAQGFSLLLVGRDPQRLAQLFPGQPCCDYDSLGERGHGFGVMLHLAAQNNHAGVSEVDFRAANVDFLLAVARSAELIGVKRFINLSSTHAVTDHPVDAYGASKAEGDRLLKEQVAIPVTTIIAPAIYGEAFQGKLAVVTRLPVKLRPTLVRLLSLIKPVVSIDHLALVVAKEARSDSAGSRSRMVADDQTANSFYRLLSRTMDLGVAVGLLVVLGWLMLVLAVMVRLKSQGPAIFAQQRIGREGGVFTCYKFRTMAVGTPERATHEVGEMMVTDIGRFLRRTKLDELPQLFNLIRNDMSLVGPRPCLASQHELIERRKAAGVLALKPGITGLAQIQDIDMSNPKQLVTVEAQYLALRTLLLDIKIILATVTGKGQGDRTAVSISQKPYRDG